MLLAHPTDGNKMFDFQIYISFLTNLILNPQGLQQNLSLGINSIDNAEPCYPQDNIAGSHLCDECGKSRVLVVGHRLQSIQCL